MNKLSCRLILAFIILLTITSWFYIAIPNCLDFAVTCFGTPGAAALAPFRYRILQGFLESSLAPGSSQKSLLFTDFVLQAAFTPAIFIGLWLWLKRQLAAEMALMGCMIFALIMIASFHYFMRSIGTMIEITTIVWGLNCLSSMQRSSS